MAEVNNVLDELRKLGFELSVALKLVNQYRNTVATSRDAEQARQVEAAVIEARFLAERLERELSYLEYLAAQANDDLDDLTRHQFS